MMEKTLRVLSSGEGGGHSHSHSHASPEPTVASSSAVSSPNADGLRARSGAEKAGDVAPTAVEQSSKGPSKLSAYLNLFGDFVHNMSASLASFSPFHVA